MNYVDEHASVCQLCGVSFDISRIRQPDEPESASWCSDNTHVDEPHGFIPLYLLDLRDCGSETSGCQGRFSRPFPENGVWTSLPGNILCDIESIPGSGCSGKHGYPGYLISVEEMKGCRAVQCLLKKTDDEVWKPEDDDQYFELGG